MKDFRFVTGNYDKFHTAQIIFEAAGLGLIQETYDVDEIQSEDSEKIAKDKAQRAFEITQKPLLISDDSWYIHGLNGFPGPYMKSINEWFSDQDLLNLTRPLRDRRVSLIQHVVYQDANNQKLFKKELVGTLLTEIKGTIGKPNQKLVSFREDGLSVSETYEVDRSQIAKLPVVWHDVVAWLQEQR